MQFSSFKKVLMIHWIAKHKNKTRYKILYQKLSQLCEKNGKKKKILGRKYAKM